MITRTVLLTVGVFFMAIGAFQLGQQPSAEELTLSGIVMLLGLFFLLMGWAVGIVLRPIRGY